MSDSEDDFMSDKFISSIETSSSSKNKTYSEKRNEQTLKSMRVGQSKNKIPLKQLEKERREQGLNTSLFDKYNDSSTSTSTSNGKDGNEQGGPGRGGENKAMGMMMRMGWKIGQGLGKRSPSPPLSSSKAEYGKDGGEREKKRFKPGDEDEEEVPRRGIGSSSTTAIGTKGRIEPLRISLWAGRTGLGSSKRERTPSPPPLLNSRDPDALDSKKLERLTKETDGFRERQRNQFKEKEIIRKERAARDKLVSFDQENGVVFHPLHALPSDPLASLPRPLLKLIYPAQVLSRSTSPEAEPESTITGHEKDSNLSAAEKIREQMRRDMLSSSREIDLGDEDEDFSGKFAITPLDEIDKGQPVHEKAIAKRDAEIVTANVDWESMVPGTKRVLSMDPETHLTFLVSQLRHEHLFCFWCAYKYKSYDEMEGQGGCPGEEEDDH